MRYVIFLFCFLFIGCVTSNKITSIGYVPKMSKIVAQGGDFDLQQKLVVTCYNKYFNQTQFGKQFNSNYKLDQIEFRKSMLVEIFLGKSTKKRSIENIRIQENKDNIQVFYEITESGAHPNGYSPFVIIETEKSRNQIQYFENGVLLGNANEKIYVK